MPTTRHRQSAPARALWLLACILLILSAAPPPTVAQTAGQAAGQDAAPAGDRAGRPADLAGLRRQALDLVNQSRRQRGLQPLSLSDALNAAAQDHAADMLQRDYYSHVSPQGEDAMDRYLARGGSRWELVEENIATCSPCAGAPDAARIERLHRGWMDSPGHRESILRPGISHFGFGIAVDADGPLYAVQTFAGPGTPPDAQPGEAAPLAPGEAGAAFARALNDRRRARSLPPLKTSPVLSALAERLLPRSPGGEVDLQPPGGLMAAPPPEERGKWRSVSVLAGSCGGCGARPDAADIPYFVDFWLEDQGSAQRLLGRAPTALGFALRAYGDGRKVAVAVLGRGR